jgi:hypothetical protein
LKNDTWQGYYRHISIKLTFLKRFGSLKGYNLSIDNSWSYLHK